tara:strand:+ start:75 stop:227 length:153 start_codon:yes stop_codon:yes gene_type:complete
MKNIIIILLSFLFLTSCQQMSEINKPDLSMPFAKCPPKDERKLKDILCRE